MGALWVTDDTLSLDGWSRQWRGFPWVSGGTLAAIFAFSMGIFPWIFPAFWEKTSWVSTWLWNLWNPSSYPCLEWWDSSRKKPEVRFAFKWQEYLKNHQVVVVCIYLYIFIHIFILRLSKRLYNAIHTCIEKRKPSTLTCKRLWACDFAMWLCGSFSRSSLNRAMHAETGKGSFLSSLISGNESKSTSRSPNLDDSFIFFT